MNVKRSRKVIALTQMIVSYMTGPRLITLKFERAILTFENTVVYGNWGLENLEIWLSQISTSTIMLFLEEKKMRKMKDYICCLSCYTLLFSGFNIVYGKARITLYLTLSLRMKVCFHNVHIP